MKQTPDPVRLAAEKREAILAADALGYSWHDLTLHPWSRLRSLLYGQLVDIASKSADTLDSLANYRLEHIEMVESKIKKLLDANDITATDAATLIEWQNYLPNAAKLLWLAAHEPQDWQSFRASPSAWLREIESWMLDHIATHEAESACRLALQILTAHHELETLPRPEKSTGKTDVGN